MQRTLVFHAAVPLSRGHRVEVVETLNTDGESSILAVTDLESSIRYELFESSSVTPKAWVGTVHACTVDLTRTRTTLVVNLLESGSNGTKAALYGADAAADAAKAEADRWGGADRQPEPEPERFW